MMTRRAMRIAAPAALGVVCVLALGGCGTKAVSASYLDGKVSDLLKTQFNATFTTTCPTSLPYKVGSHEVCTVVQTGKTAKNYVLLTIDSTSNGGHFTLHDASGPAATSSSG
jgi:hypothetical protein